MIEIKNFYDNDDIQILDSKGNIKIIEYKRDLSCNYATAMAEYYAAQMNIRKRQAVIELNGDTFITSAGAMQWIAGDIEVATNVKGIGDFFGKALKGAATSESAIKPKYKGSGTLVLEPTYKYLLIEDLNNWGREGLVVEDGMFLGCDGSVEPKVVAKANLSSAVLGNEGLFNCCLVGRGHVILESPVPREELIEIVLNNDVVKIDGSYAVCWSNSLTFTVERTTKSLIGSAASGEGLVNVYRGTGRILLAPLINK